MATANGDFYRQTLKRRFGSENELAEGAAIAVANLENSPGIEDTRRVQGLLHRCHQREFRLGPAHREIGALDPPYPVLGRDGAAHSRYEAVDERLNSLLDIVAHIAD